MSNRRMQLWSSGGGTQSTAIAALLCLGEMEPPDLAVIVDTEREMSGVWTYLDAHVLPALRARGINLVRVPKSAFATVDLYSKNGSLLIPAFTTESGDVGKLPTYCSNEWKKRVVRRWAEEQHPDAQWNTWIGFTIDEMDRCYQEPGKWDPVFPLITKRMRRSDCYAVVERMGWPPPPRSSCWMCPNRDHAAWLRMRKESPEDFAKAVAFEGEMQKHDDTMTLHRSGKLLTQIKDDGTMDMFTGRCSSGYCHT